MPAVKALSREGERGREFFAVLEGKVDIRQRGRSVKIQGGDEFLGEIALVSDAPRNATVVARSPVRALVIGDRAFNALMQCSPSLPLKVLRALAERAAPDEPV